MAAAKEEKALNLAAINSANVRVKIEESGMRMREILRRVDFSPAPARRSGSADSGFAGRAKGKGVGKLNLA